MGNWQHSKVLLTKQWDPIIGVWWWNPHCHTVMIATNACRFLVLQNWLIVLFFMQCKRFLHLGESDHRKCNACNHVFVDKSKWLWFRIPALVFSVHPSVLPMWKTSLHPKKQIILKQHTSPILLFMFVDVFRKGFLKKKKHFKQTHLPWFRREILYLFCTCIINWDVFNYFGCWNKACEVVYSVSFHCPIFATVVKLESGPVFHLFGTDSRIEEA